MSAGGRTFTRVRIILWLTTLVVAAAYVYSVRRERSQRRAWDRTLAVRVVLLAADPSAPGPALLRRSLPALAARLAEEAERHRGAGPAPFSFTAHGPVVWREPLPLGPPDGSLLSRVRHALVVWGTLRRIDEAAGPAADAADARIYVLVEPHGEELRTFAEGAGAQGGEVGMVRAAVAGGDALLALAAIGHELLHCLGAGDKYGADGHALAPQGLVEPGPGPQRFAEWMVGEVPLGPGRGRLPTSLGELAVGEATAREIGWIP
ncbi:MAG: hypothetical protein HZB56_13255 [Deltaproteobacteria bacterium]|nr:hypothetical protein [Deltaproteobacteria bacterium]